MRGAEAAEKAAKAKQKKEMEDLLTLQTENVELSQQIELIERKIKAVKDSRGKALDISIIKDATGKPADDAPPEVLELRREVRVKQRELNALRKKWCAATMALTVR